MTNFITISLLNRLINSGADRKFVRAVSAIWYLQASNDPNTEGSRKIVPAILGTLENFLVEEAKAVDDDLFNFFTSIIKNSEYGALFDEAQAIFDVGLREIEENFSFTQHPVMDIYAYYANVMLETTKQDKYRLLKILELLAVKIDGLCGLANQAEKDLF